MPQWMLFQQMQIPFPAPIGWVTIICNSHPRGSDALFWSLWALQEHSTQIFMQLQPS